MQRRLCFITGASSGIGTAFAEEYASRGWDVALHGRNAPRLNELAQRLAQDFKVETSVLLGDLADPRTPRRLVAELDRPVDGLVNNAGYAPSEEMLEAPWVDHLAFLQTMLAGPTELAYLLAPSMKANGFGRIINVSSMLGLLPAAAEGSLYGPVKSYMVRFSEALQAQLKDTGVHVTALCPGFTRTEIFARSGTEDKVQKSIPKFMWKSAQQVAKAGYEACEKNQTVHVTGKSNRALVSLGRFLPEPVTRDLMRRAGRRTEDG